MNRATYQSSTSVPLPAFHEEERSHMPGHVSSSWSSRCESAATPSRAFRGVFMALSAVARTSPNLEHVPQRVEDPSRRFTGTRNPKLFMLNDKRLSEVVLNCQRALNQRLPNCSPPPRPRRPTPMRPIRVSTSAPPCARPRARFFRAATSRTPPIPKAPAPRLARSRKWRSRPVRRIAEMLVTAVAKRCARRAAAAASGSASWPSLRQRCTSPGPRGCGRSSPWATFCRRLSGRSMWPCENEASSRHPPGFHRGRIEC